MDIVAIANICDKCNNTLGFRLLDIESKQIKDVTYNSVHSLLSKGKCKIRNLVVKNNEVRGYNGSISRLPKIVNGILVGKSPLIVISKIGDTGYIISDYKGKIAKVSKWDAIDYAENNGVANGKLVTFGDDCVIACIEGSYPVIEVKSNERGLYKGVEIEDNTKLDGIISSLNGKCLEITRDKNKLVKTENTLGSSESVENNIAVKSGKHYAIVGNTREINSVTLDKDRVIEILRDKRSVDVLERVKKGEFHRKVVGLGNKRYVQGLYIKIKGFKLNKDINVEESEKYYNELKEKIKYVILNMEVNDKEYAIIDRICSKDGIEYKVAHMNRSINNWDIKKIKLEKILESIEKYVNGYKIDNDKFIIRGLDGTYEYSISKLHEVYKNYKVETKFQVKNKILGTGLVEEVNAKGHLISLHSTKGDTLVISDDVNRVLKESIKMNDNEKLVIGRNVKTIERKAFKIFGGAYIINSIEVMSEGIVKGLYESLKIFNSFEIREKALKIEYTKRNMSEEEYMEYIKCLYGSRTSSSIMCNIRILNRLDSEFKVNAYKKLIDKELKKIKNRDIKYDMVDSMDSEHGYHFRLDSSDAKELLKRMRVFNSMMNTDLQVSEYKDIQNCINKYISEYKEDLRVILYKTANDNNVEISYDLESML